MEFNADQAAKAIAAAVGVVALFLQDMIGLHLPPMLEARVETFLALLIPLLVYFVPNVENR